MGKDSTLNENNLTYLHKKNMHIVRIIIVITFVLLCIYTLVSYSTLYKESHKVVNEIDKKSCCDSCKGTILENGNAVIYSAGYKKYYLDNPENLKYTDVCILCENPEEAFIYVNPINKSRGRCKICNRYYCGKHLDLEKNICNNCNQINVKNDNIDSKLLRQIKKNIDPIDALSKNLSFNYMKDDNAVWVYSKRKDKTIIYYLVIDEDEKFVHLMGRNVKRGDE